MEINPAIGLRARREVMAQHQQSLIKGDFQAPVAMKMKSKDLQKAVDSGKFIAFKHDAVGKMKEDFQAQAIKNGFSSEEIQKGEDAFKSMVRIDCDGEMLWIAQVEKEAK